MDERRSWAYRLSLVPRPPGRRLALARDTDKFVRTLDAKRFRQVVGKVLDLMVDATPHDSEIMKGMDGRRSDIGEFRILYRFDEETLFIDAIGKRNDDEVYRKAKRR